MKTIDIENTTYHKAGNRIWRIDSGTDYGDVWDLDIFEKHVEDYLEEGESASRGQDGVLEILEADFKSRGYKMIKNNETSEFQFLFYIEPSEDIERIEPYIDKVWNDEIETILSRTAKAKIMLQKDLESREDQYMNRLSSKI